MIVESSRNHDKGEDVLFKYAHRSDNKLWYVYCLLFWTGLKESQRPRAAFATRSRPSHHLHTIHHLVTKSSGFHQRRHGCGRKVGFWQFAPRCPTIIIGTAPGPLSVIAKQMAGLQFRETCPVQFIFCRRAFRARSKVLVGTWAKHDPAATLELLLHTCLCGCESTSIERTGFQTHPWKALFALIAAWRFWETRLARSFTPEESFHAFISILCCLPRRSFELAWAFAASLAAISWWETGCDAGLKKNKDRIP